MKRLLTILVLGSAMLAFGQNFKVAAGDLVINEIMQNPSAVSDGVGEYFEVYNISADTVDMDGWLICDVDYDSFTVDNGGPLKVAPDEYLVFGLNDTTSVNGGVLVDYVYSGMSLGNGSDELFLETADGLIVDSVYWDNGTTFPDPSGASMELINPKFDNNDGANWSTATAAYGDGDFGTPGAQNSVYADNAPPAISNMTRTPQEPGSSDAVTIKADIVDDGTVSSASVFYDAGSGWVEVAMVADTTSYSADIPAQADKTPVKFYIQATDDNDDTSISPELAPVDYYFYYVDDNPVHDGLVINEIMYNSTSTDTEYVEVINTTNAAIDLGYYIFRDDKDSHIMRFPDSLILPAGEYLVIAYDTTQFVEKYGAMTTNFIAGFNFSLNNSGDQARLYNANEYLIDMVEYDDGGDWPTEPDGDGPSLELITWEVDNNVGGNWAASTVDDGTPGAENSVFQGLQKTEVTFLCDMSVQITVGNFDPDNAHHMLVARGSFNGWAGNNDQLTRGANDIYSVSNTASYKLNAENYYKFVFVEVSDSSDNTDNWESVDNRVYVIDGTEVDNPINPDGIPERVLDVVYWNDVKATDIFTSPVNITFQVDMNNAIGVAPGDSGRAFVPATDSVYIAGPFNDWLGNSWNVDPDWQLKDDNANGIYTIVTSWPIGTARNFVYKYGFWGPEVASFDNEAGFGENHTYYVEGDGPDIKLPITKFGNLTSLYQETDVTFTCDMSVQIAVGNFDPANAKHLLVARGSFNGWAGNDDALSRGASDIYSASSIGIYELDAENYYKYVFVEVSDTSDNTDNWESVDNRVYVVDGTEVDNPLAPDGVPDKLLETVYYNNVGPGDIFQEAVTVVFKVDMNGAVSVAPGDSGLAFNAATDSVYLAGAFNDWLGNAWNIDPEWQLFDDNADLVYEISTDWPAGTARTFVYKYGFWGPDVASFDNEAGFGQNHVHKESGEGTFFEISTPFGDMTPTAIEEGSEGIPVTFSLQQNYPNPFNPSTTIRFSVAKASETSLVIYNALGQKVKTLFNGRLNPGAVTKVWDGTNQSGSQVATGIYFYQLRSSDRVMTKKMILMK